jgi:hypothetical protein
MDILILEEKLQKMNIPEKNTYNRQIYDKTIKWLNEYKNTVSTLNHLSESNFDEMIAARKECNNLERRIRSHANILFGIKRQPLPYASIGTLKGIK